MKHNERFSHRLYCFRRLAHRVWLAFVACTLFPIVVDGQDEPQTVAEASGYRATSRSAEVEAFVRTCDEMAEHVSSFQFGATVEGRPMTAALIANPTYDIDSPDERTVVMLMGNIHSGECAGKEALLKMLRQLAHDADHPWYESMVIVIVPNYNADANDKIAPGNRPRQVGPELGMGERANSQQMDLNRDFMKLDTNEAQALIPLIDRWNPHLFIDCHTTNGSRHRYCLTYDIPHNPTAPQGVVEFMRDRMMPTVTQRAADQGKDMFYYGNFNRDMTRWSTYGYEPRYSTEYVGLRGRLGVLSEAYSYVSYRERIEATEVFVTECVQFVHENADEVRAMLDDEVDRFVAAANQQSRDDPLLLLSHASEQVAFDETVPILGYDGDEEADIEVEFFGRYLPVASRQLPYAYLLPADCQSQVMKLRMHGVDVQMISRDTTVVTEITQCQSIIKSSRPFQGHEMVQFVGESREVSSEVAAGSYVVFTAQPLGRLAGYLLDPHSNDGLTTWNFFDDLISEGADHPVRAILRPIDLPIEADE